MSTYETPTSSRTDDASTAEQAKDKAKEAAGQAKRGVRDQVDARSTDAGRRVGGMAQDARSVGEELRRQGKDQPARLIEQAADRAETIGGYLERSDGDTILRDAEDFGRRRPWAVIAGGLALGLAASRFLKASSDRRNTARWDGTNATNGTNGTPARWDTGASPVLPARTSDIGVGNLGGGPA